MRWIGAVVLSLLLSACSVSVSGTPTMSVSAAARTVAQVMDFWSERGVDMENVSRRELDSAPMCHGSSFPVAMFCADVDSSWVGWNAKFSERDVRVDLVRATIDAVSARLGDTDAGVWDVAVKECLLGATAGVAGITDTDVKKSLVHRNAYVRGVYATSPETECLFS